MEWPVNDRFPPALGIEIDHARVEQQKKKDKQPDRDRIVQRPRFGGFRDDDRRLVRWRSHFAGALVAGALVGAVVPEALVAPIPGAGAFVPPAGALVSGA